MEVKEIVENLLKKENVNVVKDVIVRNVTVTPKENYVQVALTISKPVHAMVADKTDTNKRVEGETNVIFTSSYAIASLLKENDDAAFAVNYILKNPDSLSVILSRSTIDVLQERVTKGDEYKNPFASSAETTTFKDDTYINNVIKIKLGDFANRALDKIANKLLNIAI